MEPKLQAWFRGLDGQGWESPDGFDYDDEMARATELIPDLERIIGHALWQDTAVQDASYFTEVAWLDQRYWTPGKSGAVVPHIAVRFSAFGRMVTIYSGNGDRKGLMRLEPQMVALLTVRGYACVPKAVLEEAYPGADEWTRNWTWFTRFFDYL